MKDTVPALLNEYMSILGKHLVHCPKSAFVNVDIRRQTITNEGEGLGRLKLRRMSVDVVLGCAVQQVNLVDLANADN